MSAPQTLPKPVRAMESEDTEKNECTKVQNPRRTRVRESLNACANAGKARAIETQGWLCTLLEALLL